MPKSAKKRAARLHRTSRSAAKPAPKTAQSKVTHQIVAQLGKAGTGAKSEQHTMRDRKAEKPESGSKQSRVLAMLRSPQGATIATMMQATGWQQHSVRGFLAGVVRSRLRLNLSSQQVDGGRVYRITDGDDGVAKAGQSRHRVA
jgi:hypothetical protein